MVTNKATFEYKNIVRNCDCGAMNFNTESFIKYDYSYYCIDDSITINGTVFYHGEMPKLKFNDSCGPMEFIYEKDYMSGISQI